MRSAKDILTEVSDVLDGREKNYDNPKPNFDRIGRYWNAFMDNRIDPDAPLEAWEVGLMMELMKIAREQFKHTPDNNLDTIGYAVCVERIRSLDEQNSN